MPPYITPPSPSKGSFCPLMEHFNWTLKVTPLLIWSAENDIPRLSPTVPGLNPLPFTKAALATAIPKRIRLDNMHVKNINNLEIGTWTLTPLNWYIWLYCGHIPSSLKGGCPEGWQFGQAAVLYNPGTTLFAKSGDCPLNVLRLRATVPGLKPPF